MLTEEEKKKIKVEFDKKVKDLTCPMCQNKNFIMSDGYFLNVLQSDIHSANIYGKATPTIGIVCTNCGFMSQHVLGVLGLLNNKNI